MERGILQGSALSARMYLVFINDLLNNIEQCGQGAVIVDLRTNIPTPADDICLISTKYTDLQHMLNICEEYSNKWRFTFSSVKSKLVTFSYDRRRKGSKNMYLYNCPLPNIDDIVHVGLMLNSSFNSMKRTLRACNKLRSGTMSII